MSTRSLTFLYETEDSEPFTCIYKHFDGYLEGYGLELAKFLNSRKLVNGIVRKLVDGIIEGKSVFNGMNCLAAQLVEGFKEEAGDIYIYSAKTKKFTYSGSDIDYIHDYEYRVFPNKIIVSCYNEKIFEGSWFEFYDYIKVVDSSE